MLIVLKRLTASFGEGGSAFNTIPSYLELGGTITILPTEGLQCLRRRLKEVRFQFQLLGKQTTFRTHVSCNRDISW